MMSLVLGDCLVEMPKLPEKSVDLVISDLPYGVTQNKADKKLDMATWWKEIKRLLKPTGTVILTSQFPFTSELIAGATIQFRYDLIWDKRLPSGFLNANRMPLRSHEHILVFYDSLGVFNPQFTKGEKSHSKGKMTTETNRNYGDYGKVDNSEKQQDDKFPTSIIRIDKVHPSVAKHPTEKPVELAEWLVKSYSNEGQWVLDTCFGVGWTPIAQQAEHPREVQEWRDNELKLRPKL
jgi:DNA modification methylase